MTASTLGAVATCLWLTGLLELISTNGLSNPMSHILALNVAGVCCLVRLPERTWLASLATRYAEFTVSSEVTAGELPAWDVTVVHAARRLELESPWVVHEGDLTRFGVADYEGRIDLARRRAEVSTPSAEQAASALERVVGYICMQALPREHDGLLLHGAAIELDGMGLACCGPSGAGKTTLARLATGHAKVLTDETLVVSLTGSQPMLISTPFWGASTPPEMVRRRNHRLPLTALLLLEHGPEFVLEPLEPGQAALGLLATEKVAVERVSSASVWLAVVERIIAQVPAYRLHFYPEAELWGFLGQALSIATIQPKG